MLSRNDLKLYFSKELVLEGYYVRTMDEYNGEGLCDDVEPELRSAFAGYVAADEGDESLAFALKCHNILGTRSSAIISISESPQLNKGRLKELLNKQNEGIPSWTTAEAGEGLAMLKELAFLWFRDEDFS